MAHIKENIFYCHCEVVQKLEAITSKFFEVMTPIQLLVVSVVIDQAQMTINTIIFGIKLIQIVAFLW